MRATKFFFIFASPATPNLAYFLKRQQNINIEFYNLEAS